MKNIIFIFFGPQSSGKGTQSALLSNFFDFIHLSSGEILRQSAKTNTILREKLANGIRLDDKYVSEIIFDNLIKYQGKNIILDGYPRNYQQVKLLDKLLQTKFQDYLKIFIYFSLDLENIIDRVKFRLYCPNCGANYNLKLFPPKRKYFCDYCNTKLVKREDDNEEIVKRRYKEFQLHLNSIVNFYQNNSYYLYKEINANDNIKNIFNKLIIFLYDQIKNMGGN